jgi:hypothetical protein
LFNNNNKNNNNNSVSLVMPLSIALAVLSSVMIFGCLHVYMYMGL